MAFNTPIYIMFPDYLIPVQTQTFVQATDYKLFSKVLDMKAKIPKKRKFVSTGYPIQNHIGQISYK